VAHHERSTHSPRAGQDVQLGALGGRLADELSAEEAALELDRASDVRGVDDDRAERHGGALLFGGGR